MGIHHKITLEIDCTTSTSGMGKNGGGGGNGGKTGENPQSQFPHFPGGCRPSDWSPLQNEVSGIRMGTRKFGYLGGLPRVFLKGCVWGGGGGLWGGPLAPRRP